MSPLPTSPSTTQQLRVFSALGLALLFSMGLLLSPSTAAAQKKSKAAEASVKPTVALLYFDYSGKDDELSFLRKGLTQMLVTDLSQTGKHKLVERTALESVLAELKLNRSKTIDKKSANQIGKLLGARFLVTGGYFEHQGRLRVDARVIDVETGVVHSVGVMHDSANFMTLEAELVLKLEGKLLGLYAEKTATLSKRKNKKTAKRRRGAPKVEARTVARYGKALDALDQGKKKAAVKELSAIASAAPYFKPAAADLKVLLR